MLSWEFIYPDDYQILYAVHMLQAIDHESCLIQGDAVQWRKKELVRKRADYPWVEIQLSLFEGRLLRDFAPRPRAPKRRNAYANALTATRDAILAAFISGFEVWSAVHPFWPYPIDVVDPAVSKVRRLAIRRWDKLRMPV